MRSSLRAGVAAAGAAAGVVLWAAVPASAHVSVQPMGAAAKGGYATVNFKVPNERDDASTTKLEVVLPTDHPLASVMPQPVAGWSVKVTTSKLDKPVAMHGKSIDQAVSKVTWTATGKGIEPGFFQQFPLSLGQLPDDTDQLVFKTLQTYSNNEVVRWIEPQQEGQPEPDSPAPVLALSAPSQDEHDEQASSSIAPTAAKAVGTSVQAASADSSDGTARALGIAGVVVGAAGIGVGFLSAQRRGRA